MAPKSSPRKRGSGKNVRGCARRGERVHWPGRTRAPSIPETRTNTTTEAYYYLLTKIRTGGICVPAIQTRSTAACYCYYSIIINIIAVDAHSARAIGRKRWRLVVVVDFPTTAWGMGGMGLEGSGRTDAPLSTKSASWRHRHTPDDDFPPLIFQA